MATPGNFSFDSIEDFDRHIDLSIPTYTNLRDAILRMASYFVKEYSIVYDLGCSTGLTLAKLALQVDDTVRLIGIDSSDNLLGKATDHRVERQRVDLTSDRLVLAPCDLVLSVFTLQFLPVASRSTLIEKVYKALEPGGAFIVCEKTYIDDGLIQDLYTFGYYDMKRQNFSPQQILDKQTSLRRIMRPQTESENMKLLGSFGKIYPFWQYLQFKAWLCIK